MSLKQPQYHQQQQQQRFCARNKIYKTKNDLTIEQQQHITPYNQPTEHQHQNHN